MFMMHKFILVPIIEKKTFVSSKNREIYFSVVHPSAEQQIIIKFGTPAFVAREKNTEK